LCGASAVADVLQRIGEGDAGKIFDALIAKLARNAQTKRRSVRRGKFLPVQAVGEQSLRM